MKLLKILSGGLNFDRSLPAYVQSRSNFALACEKDYDFIPLYKKN